VAGKTLEAARAATSLYPSVSCLRVHSTSNSQPKPLPVAVLGGSFEFGSSRSGNTERLVREKLWKTWHVPGGGGAGGQGVHFLSWPRSSTDSSEAKLPPEVEALNGIKETVMVLGTTAAGYYCTLMRVGESTKKNM